MQPQNRPEQTYQKLLDIQNKTPPNPSLLQPHPYTPTPELLPITSKINADNKYTPIFSNIDLNMNSSLNVQISSNSKLELNKEYRIENEEYQPAAYGEWKKISGDNLGSFGFASQNIAENSLNVNLGNINNNDDGNNNYNIPANNINNTLEQNPQNQPSLIFTRTNHATFYYKNCIYMYGGHEVPAIQNNIIASNFSNSRKQSLWNSFHKYNINTKELIKQNINLGANAHLFMNISSFGYFVFGSFVFIFGGVNYQTNIRRNPEMFSINLDSGAVKRFQSKTSINSIPSARLNPIITAMQKQILILFGGEVINIHTDSIKYLNDMYTFKLQTKTWTRVQDTFHSKFPILIKPSLINFGDNCIYLLGGKRQFLGNDGSQVKLIDNYQMFKLKIVSKMVNYKAECCIREVFSTNPIPKTQSYVKIMKYSEKGLFAVTTDVENPGVNTYFWYYDHHNAVWSQVKQHKNNISDPNFTVSSSSRQDFGLTLQKIFTIQRQYGNPQIYQFDFNQTSLQSVIKQTLAHQKKVLCMICQEQSHQNKIVQQKSQIPVEYFQQFTGPLQFPFTAIGLLLDNTLLTKAKVCNVYFNVGPLGKDNTTEKQKDKDRQNYKAKYMIIEDNGYPGYIWSPELKAVDFINTITKFSAIAAPEQMMSAQDNKSLISKCNKQIEQKQKILQKQFAIFLKSQNKNPGTTNQNTTYHNPGSNYHLKTQKDFQKQQHEYLQKKHRLQHKQKMIQIQQKCRKFCNNLKLAGIRLGQTIIYACRQKKDQQNVEINTTIEKDKDLRRYFFMRKEKCSVTNKQYYVTYAYVTQNGNAADSHMQSTIKYLSKQFKKQLKIISQKLKTMNNVLFISDLKGVFTGEQNNINMSMNMGNFSSQKNIQKLSCPVYQLRLKKKQNDIFYGQSSTLNYLQTNSLTKISQICDVSLKAYLSMLYLSRDDRDDPNIYLSIRDNQLQSINVQPFLPTMDRLLQLRKTVQISKSLNFDDECPVIQVYYYPQYANNNDTIANRINSLGFMLNGILIYYKGRLISRYGVDLGKLFENLQTNQKYGSMFGFLDIKEQYGTNLYSTDMFYPRAFQKYFSRLNFVSDYMENKYKDKKIRSREDYHSSGYQKISKRSRHD